MLFEEEIGNPLNITIDTISITKVCAHVTDSNPPPVNLWRKYGTSMDHKRHHGRRPKVHLSCPPRRKISKILFASFGNPTGNCDDYAMGQCHSSKSKAIVEKVHYILPPFLRVVKLAHQNMTRLTHFNFNFAGLFSEKEMHHCLFK